jgi:hypothetical protein
MNLDIIVNWKTSHFEIAYCLFIFLNHYHFFLCVTDDRSGARKRSAEGQVRDFERNLGQHTAGKQSKQGDHHATCV